MKCSLVNVLTAVPVEGSGQPERETAVVLARKERTHERSCFGTPGSNLNLSLNLEQKQSNL